MMRSISRPTARRRADEGGPHELAHSIESRVPLLDNEVTSSPHAPSREDLNGAGARAQGGGQPAAAARDSQPQKQGFGVPLGVWFVAASPSVPTPEVANDRQRGVFAPAFVDGSSTNIWPASGTIRASVAALVFELGIDSTWTPRCGGGVVQGFKGRYS